MDQWKEEIHNKLYDSLQVQMEIYIADEDMLFDAYYKKAQQFVKGLAKAGKRTKEWKDQQELQRKRSASKFEKKSSITTTAIAWEATKPMLANVTCYTYSKKGHLAQNCPEKTKKAEAKAIESDHSDSENRLL